MNPLKPLLLLALGLAGWTSAREPAPSVRLVETTPTHRVVEHALGKAEVPLAPQRIVALSEDIIDPLLALGVTPVAAGKSVGEAFAPYYVDELEGVASVGQFWEPNLEALLAAQPDLILDWARTERPLYEQMSKVAPVVFVSTDRDAREVLLELGLVLGVEVQAQDRIAGTRQPFKRQAPPSREPSAMRACCFWRSATVTFTSTAPTTLTSARCYMACSG